MKIQFSSSIQKEKGALAVFAAKGGKLATADDVLNSATKKALEQAFKSSRFEGKKGQTLQVLSPAESGFSRIVAVGIGKPKELDKLKTEDIGGAVAAELLRSGEKDVTVVARDVKDSPLSKAEFSAHVAAGLSLRSYHFSKYLTKQPDTQKVSLETGLVITDDSKASALFEDMEKVIEGVNFTRDLVTEPSNVIYPESFAEEIKKLEKEGVEVELIKEKELKKLGFGALLAVGQGSERESVVAIMKWSGSPKGKKDAPVAFIGKGVTFDTGGISLKPAEGMEEMKWDMGGAAIVAGAMKALAGRKARVNAIGIVGLVENMPSGNAQRPGDVVKSLSGQTIEVLNTDAEGRLVLADALWYCQDKYKPKAMVDFATLTGAIIVTLGRGQYAGLFTDDDDVANTLSRAGDDSGDKVWRLPMTDEYDAMINCDIADMKNIGGKGAGSITAAQFLRRFTNDVPWAHVDVAGMVWALKAGRLWDKGATGYGVRLVDQFVRDNYESK